MQQKLWWNFWYKPNMLHTSINMTLSGLLLKCNYSTYLVRSNPTFVLGLANLIGDGIPQVPPWRPQRGVMPSRPSYYLPHLPYLLTL